VPVIDPNVFACVFYVYGSLDSAKAGEAAGGTGFFAGIRLESNSYLQQLYAITNRHCVVGSEVVLRVNKADGQLDYISTKNADWVIHPELQDIAVLPIVLSPEHAYNFVGSDMFFLTPEIVESHGIGPGDDVFMIGRFIGHDGKQGNLPTARFGNIARMNSEPIGNDSGINQDSFLVEMRSIPGFSGSPVFVYINPSLARPPHFMTPINAPYNQAWHGPWLLGIDWSHLTSFKPVLDKNRRDRAQPPQWVEINSGMAGVIPAWRIQEILELPEFVRQRRETDNQISETHITQGLTISNYAQPNTFTGADLEADLRKAARRVKSSESGEEQK
jgi:hypothetical protein